MEITAFGSPFSHDTSSCHFTPPKNHTWVYDRKCSSDIEVYMDYSICGGFNSECKNKYLWFSESGDIISEKLNYFINNFNTFKEHYKRIFVNDKSLLKLDSTVIYSPPGSNQPWVRDRGIHTKTKNMSMVASGKNATDGHKLRNCLMRKLVQDGVEVDCFGRNFRPFEYKEEVTSDYFFSIVVENGSYSNYYTEKIMDCFAAGTIPVYHGSPDIGEMFDDRGIITITDDLDYFSLNKDIYYSKIEYVKNNLHLCNSHQSADDYIYDRIMESL